MCVVQVEVLATFNLINFSLTLSLFVPLCAAMTLCGFLPVSLWIQRLDCRIPRENTRPFSRYIIHGRPPYSLPAIHNNTTVGFAQTTVGITALNLKFRHYVTLAILRIVPFIPVRQAKVFIWRKVVLPARVALPAKARKLAHLSCLTPKMGLWS